MQKKIRCIRSINYGYGRCSRNAVVNINGWPYCKQHALKVLPNIQIIPGIDNQKGLKDNLIKAIFIE